MNPLITKGLIGLGGLSIAGGGGLLAWNQGFFSRKPETMRDKLKKQGYTILEKNSSHWSQIFGVYKEDGNTRKFKNDSINASSTELDHFKLKDKCEKALELKSSDDEIYKKIIKWCVVPGKVEEVLTDVFLLGVDESNAEDSSSWKPVLKRYKGTKTGSNYVLSGITLLEPIANDTKDAENIKLLKGGYKSRREKLTYHLDFEKSMEEVKDWCVSK